ncbi:MAG: hypothetical protein FJ215_05160 [Ignavibacteria bacterium]|nr:hypothetical protein [Ignavibacteria bacterium]
MSHPRPLLLALSLVLMIPSCATDFGEVPLTIVPIEGKVEIRVAEFHRGEAVPPVVSILMRTEQIFGCVNYSVLHTLLQRGDGIFLLIHGASIGPICATALGPAASVNFIDLPAGTFLLHVEMNGRRDRYELTITSATIHLLPIDTSISRPMERLAWRYPRQSFALFAGTMAGDEWLVGAYVDSLKKRVPVREIVSPEEGRWPYDRTVTGYARNAPPRYFLYQLDSHFERAASVLREFSEEHLKGRPGVGFWIENWKRQSFQSWRLMN